MKADKIIEELKARIAGFAPTTKAEKVGEVLEIGDGVARISGLGDVGAMEMVDFGSNIYGVALNLEENLVGAMVLGEYYKIKTGDTVRQTGKILSVPVSDKLIGRVVSPLGLPKDGKGDIEAHKYYPIEKN